MRGRFKIDLLFLCSNLIKLFLFSNSYNNEGGKAVNEIY